MEEKVSCLIFDPTYQETSKMCYKDSNLGQVFLNNLVYGFLNTHTHKKSVRESID